MKQLHIYPVTKMAVDHMKVATATLTDMTNLIHQYAPLAHLDLGNAVYVSLGPKTGVTEYNLSIPILGIEAGSGYTVTFNKQFNIVKTIAVLGLAEPNGVVRSIVLKDNVVVVDARYDSSGKAISTDDIAASVTEATDPITCIGDCLTAMGVPTWLIGVAATACTIVCLATDLIACPECWYGVMGAYAGELSFCLGACGV